MRIALIVSALLEALLYPVLYRGIERSWDSPLEIRSETVPYRAQATLDGATLQVSEQITVKSDKTDSEWAKGTAWQLERIVDGSPVYRRNREVPLRRVSWVEWEAEVPIEIGWLDFAYLVPKEGSKIIISAPKGSLGVTSPAAQQLVDVPRHQELATVSLEPYDDRVVVAVRPSWLRNPIGRELDSLLTWGPTAWLLGIFAAVVSTVVVGRLNAGADSLMNRLLGPTLQAPPTPANGQQGKNLPAPRDPGPDDRTKRAPRRRRRRR
ncbi:hypothetical protein [Micromonospora chersina]|uniref:hypothetical protein n=1 Tax=Micromonospora chersina TaxID=47854 RepID=UPI00371DF3DE